MYVSALLAGSLNDSCFVYIMCTDSDGCLYNYACHRWFTMCVGVLRTVHGGAIRLVSRPRDACRGNNYKQLIAAVERVKVAQCV